MNKTKIDWADMTWNPVTGCLHGCEYCYARKIATRFGNKYMPFGNGINGLDERTDGEKGVDPYPYGFEPTFHKYRLNEPAKIKKPQTIFVCSMADLFGDWVPDEWIKAVFEATNKAPQHRYLFLTKNPDRYYQLGDGDGNIIPDGGISGWFGASACTEEQANAAWENTNCTWISIEPIRGSFSEDFFVHDNRYTQQTESRWLWVVIGAETGNRKGKVVPEKLWIDEIAAHCKQYDTPLFMKESLRSLMGADFKQEFPWGSKS